MPYTQTNFGHMLHLPNVVALFDHAFDAGVKFPQIMIAMSNGKQLKLSRAGTKSQHTGAINLTDEKPFGRNMWYGRIPQDGYLWIEPGWQAGNPELVDYIRMHLVALDEDPQLTAKLLGDETGKCCFCNKALANPISVANGYGQICAHNYGLSYTVEPTMKQLRTMMGETQQLKLQLTTLPTDLEKLL